MLRKMCIILPILLFALQSTYAAEKKLLVQEAPKQGNKENISYKTRKINNLDIFYREAGSRTNPTIVLLHGFPTSSHMYRNLIPALSKQFHLIAPDYPGFGYSSMPLVNEFSYTFGQFAMIMDAFLEDLGIKKYILYLMDYGAPIGFRIARAHPERVTGLIIQNGNTYEEGLLGDFWKPFRAYWKDKNEKTAQPLRDFLTPKITKYVYTQGARNVKNISPDTWTLDQHFLDRPGNKDIQLALFYDYQTNIALYPLMQQYLKKNQPETLIFWGKNDFIFPLAGAHAYKNDLPKSKLHVLDTGHFALEEDWPVIAQQISEFFGKAKKNNGVMKSSRNGN